jgi:hypothetical protein
VLPLPEVVLMKEFATYAVGVVCASVCSSLGLEEITRRLNEERPTGIDSPWVPSKLTNFASGEPNPCACERSPETHTHYLFNC